MSGRRLSLPCATALVSVVSAGASFLAGAAASPAPPAHAVAIDETAPEVRIERLDPRLDALLPVGVSVETVAAGFDWLEGPVWDRRNGGLLFSDIPRNAVYRWREGGTELFLERSGYSGTQVFTGREPGSNGLAFDAGGDLLLCQHGDRRISRLGADHRLVPVATHYQGRRLNSPNDLVVRSNGDVYFTDPPFGLPGGFDDPGRELPWSGVYRHTREGVVELLTRELAAPNGLAFSPDESRLYVSNAAPERAVWMSYTVAPDGSLGSGRLFFDVTDRVAPGRGLPDGLKVDRNGNLFATGPEGVYVLTSDGEHLGTIHTGAPTSNVAWGEDGSTLFVTASSRILRVRSTTSGTARESER